MAEIETTYTLTLTTDEAHAVAAALGQCLTNPWTTPVYDALAEAFWGDEEYRFTAHQYEGVQMEDGDRRNVIEIKEKRP